MLRRGQHRRRRSSPDTAHDTGETVDRGVAFRDTRPESKWYFHSLQCHSCREATQMGSDARHIFRPDTHQKAFLKKRINGRGELFPKNILFFILECVQHRPYACCEFLMFFIFNRINRMYKGRGPIFKGVERHLASEE